MRGPESKKVLSKYNIDSTITGDTALILEPSEYHTKSQNRIAVSLRDGGNKWVESEDYIVELNKFLSSLSPGWEIVFLPLKPSDIPLHMNLAQKHPNSKLKNYCTVPDVGATIEEYSNCDIVISERLHGNVLAACSYTPFISLEYRPKSKDFADSINMGNYNMRISDIKIDNITKLFESIQNDKNKIISALESNVEDKRKSIECMRTKIAKNI